MIVSIITFSDRGEVTGEKIQGLFEDATVTRCPKGGLDNWTKEHFVEGACLIYVGSCGIAVRAIAPYVSKKNTDAAVVVVDELGTYSIPILSGHLGRANEMSTVISKGIDAINVLTTATDINKVFAFDSWASKNGLKIYDTKPIENVAVRMLRNETVYVKSDLPIGGDLPKYVEYATDDKDIDVYITYKKLETNKLVITVPCVTLGVGCRKDQTYERIFDAFTTFTSDNQIDPRAVRRLASIDLKKDEKGIHQLSELLKVPFNTYSAEMLNSVKGEFTPSEFVRKTTGTDNVCERSSVTEDEELIASKFAKDGVTFAASIKQLNLKWE